jgi:hypothetical protein
MPRRIFGGIGFDLLSGYGLEMPATGGVVPWVVRSGGLTVSGPSKALDLIPWQRHSPLPLGFLVGLAPCCLDKLRCSVLVVCRLLMSGRRASRSLEPC